MLSMITLTDVISVISLTDQPNSHLKNVGLDEDGVDKSNTNWNQAVDVLIIFIKSSENSSPFSNAETMKLQIIQIDFPNKRRENNFKID